MPLCRTDSESRVKLLQLLEWYFWRQPGESPRWLILKLSSQGKSLRVEAGAPPIKSVKSLPFLQLPALVAPQLPFFLLFFSPLCVDLRRNKADCGGLWIAVKDIKISTETIFLLSNKTTRGRVCQPPKISSQPSLCSSNRTVSVQRLAIWSDISETTFKPSDRITTRTLWLGSKG